MHCVTSSCQESVNCVCMFLFQKIQKHDQRWHAISCLWLLQITSWWHIAKLECRKLLIRVNRQQFAAIYWILCYVKYFHVLQCNSQTSCFETTAFGLWNLHHNYLALLCPSSWSRPVCCPATSISDCCLNPTSLSTGRTGLVQRSSTYWWWSLSKSTDCLIIQFNDCKTLTCFTFASLLLYAQYATFYELFKLQSICFYIFFITIPLPWVKEFAHRNHIME